MYLHKVTLSSSCACSGLQEGLGQHHTGQPWPGDLLQVLLWEKVWPQRLRLWPGSRDPQHGPRGATGNQTRRVSWKSCLVTIISWDVSHNGCNHSQLSQGSQNDCCSSTTLWFRSSMFLMLCFFQAVPHFFCFFLLRFISVFDPESRTWHCVHD